MMSDKKLSVCLLAYNHAHIINDTITSIIDQSYDDFELIISDDNSTDDTYDLCDSISKNEKRIRLIKTIKNLGMAGNANYAISQAKGEYIALLHHDDILNKRTFEYWLGCMNSDENIAFVFNDYKTAYSDSTNYYLNHKLKRINQGKYFLKNFLLKRWGCPVRGTALIRKKYFDEIGGMKERFGLLADVDLWMRLSAKWDVGYINKPLIKVLQERPINYPREYTEFSWERLFIKFDIHSDNINRNNYSNYFYYLFKRFIFKNKVSFEITKWHIYAIYKKRIDILKNYPSLEYKDILFYANYINKLIRTILT